MSAQSTWLRQGLHSLCLFARQHIVLELSVSLKTAKASTRNAPYLQAELLLHRFVIMGPPSWEVEITPATDDAQAIRLAPGPERNAI